MLKVLYIRKIGIDVIPDGMPYIEIRIDMRLVKEDTGEVAQLISDYGRIYRKITDLIPIPIGNMADDGVVTSFELLSLVAQAALTWIAIEYNGALDSTGRLIIK